MVAAMVRIATVIVAATLMLSAAGPAAAGPGQPPLPSEVEACKQVWSVSTDPRVNMKYGIGAIMFYAWVDGQCAGPDAKFPNGALVAGSGIAPPAPWQQLPVPAPAPTPDAPEVLR